MLLQLDQSYEHDVPHASDNENEQWIRRKNYAGLLSGCAGTSFCPGARGNPLYTFKHWRTLMDTVGMRQARHLFALFESRSWQTLRPDRDHKAIVAGQGELTSIDYVTCALSENGNSLIAYVPSRRSLSVDMSSISGFWANAWWYDPRTGIAHFAGVHRARGVHEFDSPTGDWVLVLDDASMHLGPPGAPLQLPPRPVPLAPRPEAIGETSIFAIDDSGNGNLLITQAATIDRAARLQELSFYVSEPAGRLRLGIYDSSGPDQLPGRLIASTSELAAVRGWNHARVATPTWLAAGTYWLAYLSDDNALHFRRAGQDSGTSFAAAYPYAALPLEYPANPQSLTDQWSCFCYIQLKTHISK
jgi:hypothetical protein